MKNNLKLIGAAGAALLLSGCQSFPVAQWVFGVSESTPEFVRSEAVSSETRLEEGRQELREGQLAAAIASFRIAMRDPALRADASNGLGVAYAKLGRPDLADQYFRVAAALDPANPAFAANLLRLQQNVRMAKAQQETALAASKPAETSREPEQVRRIASNGRIQRVSPGEVRIVLPPAGGPAPKMAVATHLPAPADPGTGGQVKAGQKIIHPAAFKQGEARKPAGISTPDRSDSYPVRIALGT